MNSPTFASTNPTPPNTARNTVTILTAKPKLPQRTPLRAPRPATATALATLFFGVQSGCGCSGLNDIGALPAIEDNIGISVSDTTREIISAIETVSAWSLNNWPATPCTNTSGKNTATVVSVDATTAMLTSRVPVMAACSTPSPRSRALAMLSSTTMESSTTMPVASARPARDMTLRLSPNRSMKKKVAMMDTGKESPITNVLQPSRRKKKMIRIDSTPPISASNLTSASALRMNLD